MEDTSYPGKLSNKYWSTFLKRNKERLCIKRGVKFGNSRAAWCTLNNFSKMYDLF